MDGGISGKTGWIALPVQESRGPSSGENHRAGRHRTQQNRALGVNEWLVPGRVRMNLTVE